MKHSDYPTGTTFVTFKIFSDVDGSNQSYGYVLSNAELDFYDYYYGEESLVRLVDMGLEPMKVIQTLRDWYPELEVMLKTYGVVLNDVLIKEDSYGLA